MRKLAMVFLTGSALLGAGMVSAQGMGMGGGGMMGGAGMLQVAGDGSLLVTRMEAGMMGGGQQGMERSVTNISTSGVERWSTEFDSGWPMMLATNGDLVVVVLADDWWMGGPGSGPMHQGDAYGAGGMMSTTVVAVSRAGQVEWTLDLSGGHMGGPPAARRQP